MVLCKMNYRAPILSLGYKKSLGNSHISQSASSVFLMCYDRIYTKFSDKNYKSLMSWVASTQEKPTKTTQTQVPGSREVRSQKWTVQASTHDAIQYGSSHPLGWCLLRVAKGHGQVQDLGEFKQYKE
jgi:hypothetical protein